MLYFVIRLFHSKHLPPLHLVSSLNLLQVGFGVGSILIDMVSGWRYMYVACTPLAVIMGIGICWLPNAPRWLLLRAIQGKGNGQNLREAAILCLRRLRGPAIGDSAPLLVDEIMGELYYIGEEKEVTMREVFQGKCFKAVVIGAGLLLFQQVIIFLKKLNTIDWRCLQLVSL